MDVFFLNGNDNNNLNQSTGCLCRYVRSDTENFILHTHNYFELFLIVKGSCKYYINGNETFLSEGNLLFVRDFDIHQYSVIDGNYFEFINLAFKKELFFSLCDYLGEDFSPDEFLIHDSLPTVRLSLSEKENLLFALTELNQNLSDAKVRIKLKALLPEVFIKYLKPRIPQSADAPFWLIDVYDMMQIPKNFIAGNKRIYELCGKSREHLSRCMKKYYGISVSEFITKLRLEYAANLLLTSNLTATDICYECGFENLSWFYKAFAAKYNCTPSKFRKGS